MIGMEPEGIDDLFRKHFPEPAKMPLESIKGPAPDDEILRELHELREGFIEDDKSFFNESSIGHFQGFKQVVEKDRVVYTPFQHSFDLTTYELFRAENLESSLPGFWCFQELDEVLEEVRSWETDDEDWKSGLIDFFSSSVVDCEDFKKVPVQIVFIIDEELLEVQETSVFLEELSPDERLPTVKEISEENWERLLFMAIAPSVSCRAFSISPWQVEIPGFHFHQPPKVL